MLPRAQEPLRLYAVHAAQRVWNQNVGESPDHRLCLHEDLSSARHSFESLPGMSAQDVRFELGSWIWRDLFLEELESKAFLHKKAPNSSGH